MRRLEVTNMGNTGFISKRQTGFISKRQTGFIALTTVLIISAVALAITVTVVFLSIGQGQSAFSLTNGESSLSFVEGCMEDALLKIRASANYSSGTITRPEGTCTVTVSKVGNVYTVTTTQTGLAYQRKVQVVVTRGSSLILSSWKEI